MRSRIAPALEADETGIDDARRRQTHAKGVLADAKGLLQPRPDADCRDEQPGDHREDPGQAHERVPGADRGGYAVRNSSTSEAIRVAVFRH